IEDERDSPTHSRAKVPACLADHYHGATRHVFTAVIADAFDDGLRAAVSHGKSLARSSREEGPPARAAVQDSASYRDVVAGDARRVAGGRRGENGSGQALTDIVVGVALERDRHSLYGKRTEGLSCRPLELDPYRFLRQTRASVLPCDLAGEHCAECAVGIGYG